jgi:hypothetical protein
MRLNSTGDRDILPPLLASSSVICVWGLRMRITLDLTRIRDIQQIAGRTRPVRMPGYQQPAPGDQTAILAGMTALSKTGGASSAAANFMLDAKTLEVRVAGSIRGASLPPASIGGPAATAGTPSTSGLARGGVLYGGADLTIAVGPELSSSFFITGSLGYGIYVWIPRWQFGVYGTSGVGITAAFPTIIGVGASAVTSVCVLFGPAPVVLAGFSFYTGLSVSGEILTGGFGLIWSLKWELLGFAFQFGGGFGFPGATFTFEVSATVVKPIHI